jgi:outer membrane protein assembly factor BamA
VTKARESVEALYRRAGFGAASTQADTRVDLEAGTASVAIEVSEGVRQVLKEVAVEGAAGREREKAEELLRLTPGSPVDLDLWADARQRIYETGLYRGVDVEPVVDEAGANGANGTDEKVTAKVHLENWPALRLRYGLQLQTEGSLASEEGRGRVEPGAVAELTRRTLFGHAVSTGLAVQARQDEQQARAFLSVPRTFGLPVRSSLFLSTGKDVEVDDELGGRIDTLVTELTFEERARVTRRIDLSGAYSVTWNRTDLPRPLPTFSEGVRIDTRLASLTGTALFDARNDLIDTTRGSFSSVSYEWGDSPIGSEFPLQRLVGQQFVYVPWRRVVVGGAARMELAHGEGTYFLQDDRLEAGGANTVRGYSQDELASRALINLLGGTTTLFVLNAELRFPIKGSLRGAVFADGGILLARLEDDRETEKIWSTGLGVRYVTPIGILRLDFGIPLDEGFKPKRGHVYFSLGQIF